MNIIDRFILYPKIQLPCGFHVQFNDIQDCSYEDRYTMTFNFGTGYIVADIDKDMIDNLAFYRYLRKKVAYRMKEVLMHEDRII